MLSAVITALLFIVMLLLVASFLVGASRERRRHLRSLAEQAQECSQPSDLQVTAILQLQDGTVIGVKKTRSPFVFPYLPPGIGVDVRSSPSAYYSCCHSHYFYRAVLRMGRCRV